MAMNNLRLCVLAILLVVGWSNGVAGMEYEKGWSALVSGNVFCDQCLKNEVFPFALPMSGAKVTIQCYGADGSAAASTTVSTDFLGGFFATFKDVSNLDGCNAVMTSTDSACAMTDGGAHALSFKSKFFFNSFYTTGPMFFKPAQPKSFCPGSPTPKPPPFNFPPLPPSPWEQPSTCTPEQWMNSEFFCHWKNATPFQTTVGMMFGKDARKRYGDKNLYDAMKDQSGQDDLLKQAIGAMMNAYSNPMFGMTPRAVRYEFNMALKGSQQLKWDEAWKFKQANLGWGNGKCMLTPCK